MSRVTYVGPNTDGVVVEPTFGTQFYVAHRETVEVDEDVAERLVEQGEFVHAAAGGDGAPPKGAPKDEWSAYRAAQGHDVDGLTKDELIELPDTPQEG
jgi:hypothetical protein